ncbi:MAG: dephospho-CoA kinase [candidate division WOR-3 bacterium]|nr:dephospho-CoA kinase [candidate division WOR-3 bacterium]MDH5683032.1 dephospho-CoA kinase [candidate division WOR-3 bacterium]
MAKSSFVVGIGGNIGSGKTTLAKIFQEFGAEIVDADRIGWSLLKKSTKEYRKVIKTFGESILDKDQNVDRKKLGEIIFANPRKLRTLNRIVHPALLSKLRQEIRKKEGMVVIDAALLFNWRMEKEIDAAILVSAPKRLKIERIRKLGMSRKEVEQRLNRQMPETMMAKKADFIIKNNGTRQDLRNKAAELWQLFSKCQST